MRRQLPGWIRRVVRSASDDRPIASTNRPIGGLCRLGPVEAPIAQCNKIGLQPLLLGCVLFRFGIRRAEGVAKCAAREGP
jgi:hypothetical protein